MLVQYDPILVILSVVIAILGSFTGFVLASDAPWLRHEEPKKRIMKGAIAIGGGIWSMHFIGMLAVKLPITVSYDVLLTMISAFTSILVTGIGLYFCSYRPRTRLCYIFGGVFMGSGIAGMHYIGMSAIRAGCILSYSQPGVILSVIIAIFASIWALRFAFRSSDIKETAIGGAVLGLTISAMHYTGMIATSFIPVRDAVEIATPVFTSSFIANVVAIGSFIFFGLSLLMALPDSDEDEPQMAALTEDANIGEEHMPEQPRAMKRVPVEKNGATIFLDPCDIRSIAADGHYSIVTYEDNEYFCDMSISKIERFVRGSGIIRSHRSFLVNLNHVKAFRRDRDRGLLVMSGSGDSMIPVSRSKLEIIREKLETGLEMSNFSRG